MLEIVKNYHTQLSNRKVMILRKTKRRNITCAEITTLLWQKKKKKERLKNSLKKKDFLRTNYYFCIKPFGQFLRIKVYLIKDYQCQ